MCKPIDLLLVPLTFITLLVTCWLLTPIVFALMLLLSLGASAIYRCWVIPEFGVLWIAFTTPFNYLFDKVTECSTASS